MATTTAQMVRDARTWIRNWSPAEVEANLFAPDAYLVDVREPEELDEHGLIVGAHHVPRGMVELWADPASDQHRPGFDPGRRTILYCDTGARSALAADALRRLGYVDVGHLDGGLAAWTAAGLPVVGARMTARARTGPTRLEARR